MEMEGEFVNRKIRATRPASGSFTLVLDEVTPSDAGTYQCDVSEGKTSSKSQATTVTVIPIGRMSFCLFLQHISS